MSIEQALAAIRSGGTDELATLITENPALPSARDENGVSLVLLALYHRQETCARQLADARDALDLWEAAALGDTARVEALLDDVDARAPDGFTALHLAAFFGRRDTAALLCARGADPNAVAANPSRVRPLHSAAAVADVGILTTLLNAGADVDATQAGGWTALHAVAKLKAQPCIEILLAAGADLNRPTDDGVTPADLLAS